MARRTGNNEPGVNMDSLMDALTNVVAVLILILILLQVDVGQAVDKLLGDLKPASPEQIEQSKKQLTQVNQQLDKQKAMLNAPAPKPEDIDKVEADLTLLEKSLKDSSVKLLEINKVKQLLATNQKLADEEKSKTDLILSEINRIKALLDQTPIPKAPQPTVVKIPNSREIPTKANIYYCYIIKDQAHLVDPITAKKMVMDEFNANDRLLFREFIKIKGKPDTRVYDQDKVVKFYEQKNLMVRSQSISVPYNRPWTKMSMVITLDPEKGDASLADMEQPKGRFYNICYKVKSYFDCVLIFKVNPNGFATYLKAREIADSLNIPCGWEIDGNTVLKQTLDFQVNRLEQPPEQKAPAGPPAIPAPKRKLD